MTLRPPEYYNKPEYHALFQESVTTVERIAEEKQLDLSTKPQLYEFYVTQLFQFSIERDQIQIDEHFARWLLENEPRGFTY